MGKRRVFVIGGGGMVGATSAHALAMAGAASEIVLIDIAEELVQGQATDISHATGFSDGVRVRVGGYDDIYEDDICVITCGLPRTAGQSRLELGQSNVKIVENVTRNIMEQGKPVYIVVVTNPVDVLTYAVLNVSGLPKNRVFGTGTTLDTARLRVAIATDLGVVQSSVEAYVLGEHGESSFAALSHASIGGIPLDKFPGFRAASYKTIDDDTRRIAAGIIAAKKSTYFGISNVVTRIVEALGRDIATILPVCSLAEGEYGVRDVVIGLPTLVSSEGVKILDHYPLSSDEREKLERSSEILHSAARGLGVTA